MWYVSGKGERGSMMHASCRCANDCFAKGCKLRIVCKGARWLSLQGHDPLAGKLPAQPCFTRKAVVLRTLSPIF